MAGSREYRSRVDAVQIKSRICPLVPLLPPLACLLVDKCTLPEGVGAARHVGRNRRAGCRWPSFGKWIRPCPLWL